MRGRTPSCNVHGKNFGFVKFLKILLFVIFIYMIRNYEDSFTFHKYEYIMDKKH